MEVLLLCPAKSLTLASSPVAAPPRRRRFRVSAAAAEEIRVCTNRTCRRQGSFQTLETLAGLAPPGVSVSPCGCLGRCGAGPNLVALPAGAVVGHCATAARAAEVMVALCGGGLGLDAAKKSLEALALRKKAEIESQNGNFSEAESLLSHAIELKPMGGIHIIFKDRSVARLAMSKCAEALDDAKEALMLAPRYVEGYICQGDAFMATNQFDCAEKSYITALEIDPSIRRSNSFKVFLNFQGLRKILIDSFSSKYATLCHCTSPLLGGICVGLLKDLPGIDSYCEASGETHFGKSPLTCIMSTTKT